MTGIGDGSDIVERALAVLEEETRAWAARTAEPAPARRPAAAPYEESRAEADP